MRPPYAESIPDLELRTSSSRRLKFYDFLDKEPPIGNLVVIEGTERVLADRAFEVILDRLLAAGGARPEPHPFCRGEPHRSGARPRGGAGYAVSGRAARRRRHRYANDALGAAPRSLGRRAKRAGGEHARAARSAFAALAAAGAFGALAGRTALRIDTTAGEDDARAVRRRDACSGCGARPTRASSTSWRAAKPTSRRCATISRSSRSRASESRSRTSSAKRWRSRIQRHTSTRARWPKGGSPRRSPSRTNPSANDPRNAAIPLLSALATECNYLWELARPGGELPVARALARALPSPDRAPSGRAPRAHRVRAGRSRHRSDRHRTRGQRSRRSSRAGRPHQRRALKTLPLTQKRAAKYPSFKYSIARRSMIRSPGSASKPWKSTLIACLQPLPPEEDQRVVDREPAFDARVGALARGAIVMRQRSGLARRPSRRCNSGSRCSRAAACCRR